MRRLVMRLLFHKPPCFFVGFFDSVVPSYLLGIIPSVVDMYHILVGVEVVGH